MSKGVQNKRFWPKGGALSLGIRTSILVSTRHHGMTLDEKQTTNCFFPSPGEPLPRNYTVASTPRRSRAPGTKAWFWTVFRRSNGQLLKTLACNLQCPSKCKLTSSWSSLHVNVACLTPIIRVKPSYLQETLNRMRSSIAGTFLLLIQPFFYPCNEGKYLNYCLQGHQDG